MFSGIVLEDARHNAIDVDRLWPQRKCEIAGHWLIIGHFIELHGMVTFFAADNLRVRPTANILRNEKRQIRVSKNEDILIWHPNSNVLLKLDSQHIGVVVEDGDRRLSVQKLALMGVGRGNADDLDKARVFWAMDRQDEHIRQHATHGFQTAIGIVLKVAKKSKNFVGDGFDPVERLRER